MTSKRQSSGDVRGKIRLSSSSELELDIIERVNIILTIDRLYDLSLGIDEDKNGD